MNLGVRGRFPAKKTDRKAETPFCKELVVVDEVVREVVILSAQGQHLQKTAASACDFCGKHMAKRGGT